MKYEVNKQKVESGDPAEKQPANVVLGSFLPWQCRPCTVQVAVHDLCSIFKHADFGSLMKGIRFTESKFMTLLRLLSR